MYSLRQHIKKTIQLAYPVVIGQLGHIMMGVVDSLMVGKVGAVPLAAASIANGIFFLIVVIGIGVTYAISPLVAIEVGAKRISECSKILRQSTLVNIVLSMLMILVIFFGAELIFLFNQPAQVAKQAVSYLKILSFSIFPFMLFQTFRQFIEGLAVMRPAMLITIAANFVNAFANWILIFGKLGFEPMGLDGAGWATFASRLFMAAAIIIFVMNSEHFIRYELSFHYKTIDWNLIKRILKIGLPSGFQYFFEVGAFSFAAIMVGWIGAKELAAHQIAINLASITYMVAVGISAAGSIRVGNAVGRQDIKETRRAGFSALILSAAFMGFSALTFILLRNFFPTLYISDVKVIEIASFLLLIAAVFQISDGIQAVGLGVLRGITDVRVPTIITFVAYWIIGLPIGYALGILLGFGVQGIWIGLLIGLSASALMLAFRFNFKSKKIVDTHHGFN